jgi:hypothetical protein
MRVPESSLAGTIWLKSTYSGAQGDCVEISDGIAGTVPVRNSKDPKVQRWPSLTMLGSPSSPECKRESSARTAESLDQVSPGVCGTAGAPVCGGAAVYASQH